MISEQEKVELIIYHKTKELDQYAYEFFKQIKEDVFSDLYTEILPIRFYAEDKYFQEGLKTRTFRKGDLDVSKKLEKQVIINIYDVKDGTIETLKQSIRHEIIHYSLYVNDLEYEDNTAAFCAMASFYNANPYKALSGIQKDIYSKYDYIIAHYNQYRVIMGMPLCKDEQYDFKLVFTILIKKIFTYENSKESQKYVDDLYEDICGKCNN